MGRAKMPSADVFKKKLVVWGASGHALVVADAVRLAGEYEIAGFLDDLHPGRHGEQFCGALVLGGVEMLDSLWALGVGAMGSGDTSIFFPKYQVFEVPYVMRDADHFWKFWNGPVGKEINDVSLNQRGVMTSGVVWRGARYLTANREIRTPEQVKGLRIRLPENKPWVEIWKSLGAQPVVVAFPEVYMALKTGVVDGQENPTPTINGFKFYEAQKYLMLTEHIITPLPMIINERVWRSLSPDSQKIMLAAAQEARELNNKLMLEQEDAFLDSFRKAGMTIVKPDVEAFRKASASVAGKFEGIWGKGLYEKIVNTK